MFPTTSREGIDKVHQLAGGNSNTIIGVLLNPTADKLLTLLSEHVLTGETAKCPVDEDDLFSDALAFYKCEKFDPSRPIRVIMRTQTCSWYRGYLVDLPTIIESNVCGEMFIVVWHQHFICCFIILKSFVILTLYPKQTCLYYIMSFSHESTNVLMSFWRVGTDIHFGLREVGLQEKLGVMG